MAVPPRVRKLGKRKEESERFLPRTSPIPKQLGNGDSGGESAERLATNQPRIVQEEENPN